MHYVDPKTTATSSTRGREKKTKSSMKEKFYERIAQVLTHYFKDSLVPPENLGQQLVASLVLWSGFGSYTGVTDLHPVRKLAEERKGYFLYHAKDKDGQYPYSTKLGTILVNRGVDAACDTWGKVQFEGLEKDVAFHIWSTLSRWFVQAFVGMDVWIVINKVPGTFRDTYMYKFELPELQKLLKERMIRVHFLVVTEIRKHIDIPAELNENRGKKTGATCKAFGPIFAEFEFPGDSKCIDCSVGSNHDLATCSYKNGTELADL